MEKWNHKKRSNTKFVKILKLVGLTTAREDRIRESHLRWFDNVQ